MRRALILGLLYIGVQLIIPLGARGMGSQALLAFSFLMLAAYTVGEIAESTHLPRIVGYMLAGVLFGPHVLGPVSAEGVSRLGSISDLAVALIAYLAGSELRWSEVRVTGIRLLKITASELFITFLALAAFMYAIHGWIAGLATSTTAEALVFAVLFASIAIVHSPAVTMALLSETRAQGPVSRTTLGIVLIADVVVVIVFSVCLAIGRSLVATAGAQGTSFSFLLWEIGGAFIVGGILGGIVSTYLRFVRRELVFFAILITFFGIEIAHVLHVETLLTLLVAGFVTQNTSRHGDTLRLAMERSAAPVFVVFFALAGANIDLHRVAPLLLFVVPIAIVRVAGIWAGTLVGGKWARIDPAERRLAWPGLVSQAGVAIGLAAIVADAYPERGPQFRDLLLALIAVNQLVGPVLFRRALAKAGELTPASTAQ